MSKMEKLSALIEHSLVDYPFSSQPENLYDPLRYFMTLGGKRIRPVLTLLSAELFSVPAEKALHAALSVELFHNFSLIHDDIMDAAPLRRAKQTVHTKWNQNIAILSGDVLLVKAYQEICQQEAVHLPALLSVFNQTALEVCEGQQMDMDFETRNDVSIEEYIEMIRLKTSVLLGCALEMGAILSNANSDDRKHIYAFGQDLGIAFQIKDDILDLYGDPEKFGKQIGGDVIANKKTLLYLYAKSHGDTHQLDAFQRLEKETDLAKKVKHVRQLFDELGVLEYAKSTMQLYQSKAMHSLEKIQVSESQKQDLKDLAHYLMAREN